jgi:PD-(D/E)XK nuclease superfamily
VTQIDLSQVALKAPPIPSKWDVIPCHASDRGAFKFCRRQWSWSSPTRRNLIPKTMVHGIRINLWFGTGIHKALEHYYNPGLSEDPEIAFMAWFDLEWNGGFITEDELPQYVDRFPQKQADGRIKIEGLREILPSPDEELFQEHLQLGIGMMKFYKDYAKREDNFSVISTEHEFSVPILDPSGEALYMADERIVPDDWILTREENIFGPLMYEAPNGKIHKQVHARGRQDLLIQDNESGRYGIIDYKTTSRLDDDYFRHLELDEQCTTYLWAGEIEAKLYGLEYKELDFILYQAMLKAYPKPPTITSRGIPSINRNDESTTAKMFEQCINANPVWKMMYDRDIKWQNYYTWLLELGDRRFIDRKDVWRNKTQRHNAGVRYYYEALDMLGNPVAYPNPTKNYSCLNCVFRAPCIAAEDGSDFEAILKDGYMPNWDR